MRVVRLVAAAAAARAGTEDPITVAKQNYRQAKRQKELARKTRQQEKLQKKGSVPPETIAEVPGNAPSKVE